MALPPTYINNYLDSKAAKTFESLKEAGLLCRKSISNNGQQFIKELEQDVEQYREEERFNSNETGPNEIDRIAAFVFNHLTSSGQFLAQTSVYEERKLKKIKIWILIQLCKLRSIFV